MQAASDIYLGWTKGVEANRWLYWRQLRDMKGSADVESLKPFGLISYARQCGWTLARAHARSGMAERTGNIGGPIRLEHLVESTETIARRLDPDQRDGGHDERAQGDLDPASDAVALHHAADRDAADRPERG
jgi:hypothetical protein